MALASGFSHARVDKAWYNCFIPPTLVVGPTRYLLVKSADVQIKYKDKSLVIVWCA